MGALTTLAVERDSIFKLFVLNFGIRRVATPQL